MRAGRIVGRSELAQIRADTKTSPGRRYPHSVNVSIKVRERTGIEQSVTKAAVDRIARTRPVDRDVKYIAIALDQHPSLAHGVCRGADLQPVAVLPTRLQCRESEGFAGQCSRRLHPGGCPEKINKDPSGQRALPDRRFKTDEGEVRFDLDIGLFSQGMER